MRPRRAQKTRARFMAEELMSRGGVVVVIVMLVVVVVLVLGREMVR